jgi:hypothetical protein
MGAPYHFALIAGKFYAAKAIMCGVLVVGVGDKTAQVALCTVPAGITYRLRIDAAAYQLYNPVKGLGHGPPCVP